MILTCPQCESRFMLPAETLGSEGRRVKCSSCGAVWQQLPDPDELKEAAGKDESAAEALSDIPNSVKPLAQDKAPPPIPEEGAPREWLSKKALSGYAAALCVFFIVFGALLLFKDSMVSSWRASAGFYQALGFRIDTLGGGLVFDQVHAAADSAAHEGEDIVIEGHIINLTGQKQMLPLVQATARAEDGTALQQWIIDIDQSSIKAEDHLPFKTVYNTGKGAVHDVEVRFVLSDRTGGAQSTAPAEEEHHEEPSHPDEHH